MAHDEGPAGGSGGSAFRDQASAKGKIRLVSVRHGELIDAIQVVFEENGVLVPHPRRGGGGGTESFFVLDKDEHITSVSGKVGTVVDSMTITSNKKSLTYGGRGGDRSYTFTADANEEVSGFFGGSGQLLDRIGVVIQNRT